MMNQHPDSAPSTDSSTDFSNLNSADVAQNRSRKTLQHSEELGKRSPTFSGSRTAADVHLSQREDEGCKRPGTLIVFTRYPVPGQTKTRLIPALGAEGAAVLQRQMTEHTLETVQSLVENQLENQSAITPDIRFSGGTHLQMQQWLGDQWRYTPQGEGGLGDRLIRAFDSAFAHGAAWAIAIGIDCPEITSTLLQTAIEALVDQDLVLGPATDGGYYLIGLSRFTPDMFIGIDWGSDRVLQQTLSAAQGLRLRTAQLAALNDIDRPEDLAVWHSLMAANNPDIPLQETGRASELEDFPTPTATPTADQPSPRKSCFLSIIVPVLNEADQIDNLLGHLNDIVMAGASSPKSSAVSSTVTENVATGSTETGSIETETVANVGAIANGNCELIVVDGGSEDSTYERLLASGITVFQSPPGRACQMNRGAQVAQGEVLLFLHADTRLPADALNQMRTVLAQPETVAGAFRLKISGTYWGFRWVEWGVEWRSRLCQLTYGDQGLFLRKSTFEAVGGFPELPIMEDYEMARRLQAQGKVAIASSSVITSGRRWQHLGIVQTTILNQIIILGYHLGFSPQQLNQWYRGKTPVQTAAKITRIHN